MAFMREDAEIVRFPCFQHTVFEKYIHFTKKPVKNTYYSFCKYEYGPS